jgi:hypothetical protein
MASEKKRGAQHAGNAAAKSENVRVNPLRKTKQSLKDD